MKSQFVLLVLAAGLAVACRSDAEKPEPAPTPVAAPAQPEQAAPVPARAERLAAIIKEQRDASSAYQAEMQKALGGNQEPTIEELQKAEAAVKQPDWKSYTARAQQLLDEDVKDLAAFKTIQWMLNSSAEPESRKTLLGLIERYHMERPEMGDMCNLLVRHDRGLLEKLAASSPHIEVRGRAALAQAEALKGDIESAGDIKGKTPEELSGMKEWLGEAKLAELQALDVEKTQARMEQIYERVATEFNDVVINKGTKRETTLGKQATLALFEIRNLAVGKTTPEIEGVDLDNVAFKLSDYRGKVVLLDFWGNW